MHDLKGHLSNVFTELPCVLKGDIKEECEQIIKYNTRKDKVSCADFRLTAIQVYLKLRQELTAQDPILLLMETAVRISDILYLYASSRSPKRVLELYNCTWLHHMLCREVFPTTRVLTRNKLFGTYLHHLCAHAPQQYEVVPLRSINTEHEERLFGQAKQIAQNASNRQPENAIFNIFVRLSASKVLGELKVSTKRHDTQVSRAATHLPPFQATTISKHFIQKHSPHWQAHLKRISSFLVYGVDVWWHSDTDNYIFHDGTNDPEYHPEGPALMHYRNASIESVCAHSELCWDDIIKKKIKMPAITIKLYDQDGSPTGELSFESPQDTPDSLLSTPLSSTSHTSTHLTPCNPDLHHLASRALFANANTATDLEQGINDQDINQTSQNKQLQRAEMNAHDHDTLCEDNGTTVLEGVNLDSLLQEHVGSSEASDDDKLKTKLATAIAKIIGTSDELKRFDNVRADLKAHKHAKEPLPTHKKEEHDRLIALLQSQILHTKGELKDKVKKYELEYHKKKGHLPKPTLDQHYKSLLKALKYVKWLLSIWNVSL